MIRLEQLILGESNYCLSILKKFNIPYDLINGDIYISANNYYNYKEILHDEGII